ncbi:MAG TPA: hypothetical protein ENG35_00175, partial [Desulfobacteraceae bacterium]|nr:hypothetical protein [Desulfobacteraceae bacterium]
MSLPMAGKYWAEFLKPPGINQTPRKWNPITGCPNLHEENGRIVGCKTPDGYSYCYQADMCNRFQKIHKPEYRFHEDRIYQISFDKPSIVAVGTSGDFPAYFWKNDSEDITEKMLELVEKMKNTFRHFFIFLTRSPENYFKSSDNIGIGAT